MVVLEWRGGDIPVGSVDWGRAASVIIAELCYGHILVVGLGFGEPMLSGE